MKGIILLDIDDTILPTVNTHAGIIKDHHMMFNVNINRLLKICDTFDIDVALISSWCTHIKRVDLKFDNTSHNCFVYSGTNKTERLLFDKMRNLLGKRLVDIRENHSKEKYIKHYIQDKTYDRVIVLEDTDFSSCCNYNNGSFYIEGSGFISNRNIGIIKNIMTEKDYKGV